MDRCHSVQPSGWRRAVCRVDPGIVLRRNDAAHLRGPLDSGFTRPTVDGKYAAAVFHSTHVPSKRAAKPDVAYPLHVVYLEVPEFQGRPHVVLFRHFHGLPSDAFMRAVVAYTSRGRGRTSTT